jgi:hypothetical protein
MSEPFNKKLHAFLLSKGYKYTEYVRYDRYDKDKMTVFFYLSGYIMILDDLEPADNFKTLEITENM